MMKDSVNKTSKQTNTQGSEEAKNRVFNTKQTKK